MEQIRIENVDIAIASFVSNPKNCIVNGTTTPPPPMPETVLMAITIGIIKSPMNSDYSIGNIFL